MKPFEKAEAEAIIYFLRDNFPDDCLRRVRALLTGESSSAKDNEEEDLLPRSHGMDASGRRLVRPASAEARKAFEQEQGIARRPVRVLG